MNGALLEGHGPLVGVRMSQRRLDALVASLNKSEEAQGFLLAGVSLYVEPWLSDQYYVEVYADGAMRVVVTGGPTPRPSIRRRHQMPLRNMRRDRK